MTQDKKQNGGFIIADIPVHTLLRAKEGEPISGFDLRVTDALGDVSLESDTTTDKEWVRSSDPK